MGGSISTHLDAPYAQQPETRALAVRALNRLGAADLIEILGLTEESEPEPPRPELCANGHRLPSHGVCRRSEQCRADARAAGYSA